MVFTSAASEGPTVKLLVSAAFCQAFRYQLFGVNKGEIHLATVLPRASNNVEMHANLTSASQLDEHPLSIGADGTVGLQARHQVTKLPTVPIVDLHDLLTRITGLKESILLVCPSALTPFGEVRGTLVDALADLETAVRKIITDHGRGTAHSASTLAALINRRMASYALELRAMVAAYGFKGNANPSLPDLDRAREQPHRRTELHAIFRTTFQDVLKKLVEQPLDLIASLGSAPAPPQPELQSSADKKKEAEKKKEKEVEKQKESERKKDAGPEKRAPRPFSVLLRGFKCSASGRPFCAGFHFAQNCKLGAQCNYSHADIPEPTLTFLKSAREALQQQEDSTSS